MRWNCCINDVEQRRQLDVAALPFEDRLALLVDREAIERENKCLVSRLKFPGLRDAAIEDLDTKAVRGLDKALFAKLAAGDWIADYKKLFVDTVYRLSMISLTGEPMSKKSKSLKSQHVECKKHQNRALGSE